MKPFSKNLQNSSAAQRSRRERAFGLPTAQSAIAATQHLPFPIANPGPPVIFSNECRSLLAFYKWPRIKTDVPSIFLHDPLQIADYVKEILTLNIKFYKPLLRQFYTKLLCVTYTDYKFMLRYLNKKPIPYHTHSHALKNYYRIMIKGLPKNMEANVLHAALTASSIPVKEVYKIPVLSHSKVVNVFFLVSLPLEDRSKRILWVKSIFGQNVIIEESPLGPKHCLKCMRWGHTELYCRGITRCSWCSDRHYSTFCTKDQTKGHPICANCWGEHRASYKGCYFCPSSNLYRATELQLEQLKYSEIDPNSPPVQVTFENCHDLYANLRNRSLSTAFTP